MNKNLKKICIILCTVPNIKFANFICKKLITKKLATCITNIPNITSFYFWNNNLEKKKEIQLIIKTNIKIKDITLNEIKKYHPYKIPELLILNNIEGDKKYLSWINNYIIE